MPITKTKCGIEGCTAQTRGRHYCAKHLREKRLPQVISNEARLTMRSSCCNAACVEKEGEKHEYGKQFCSKCHEACQWKTVTKSRI